MVAADTPSPASLSTGMLYVTMAAAESYDDIHTQSTNEFWRIMCGATAALLRKVYPVHGDYKKAGWAPYDITPQ